jgi:hypothetical protein
MSEQMKPLDEHEPGCWCPEHLRLVGTVMRNVADALAEVVRSRAQLRDGET